MNTFYLILLLSFVQLSKEANSRYSFSTSIPLYDVKENNVQTILILLNTSELYHDGKMFDPNCRDLKFLYHRKENPVLVETNSIPFWVENNCLSNATLTSIFLRYEHTSEINSTMITLYHGNRNFELDEYHNLNEFSFLFYSIGDCPSPSYAHSGSSDRFLRGTTESPGNIGGNANHEHETFSSNTEVANEDRYYGRRSGSTCVGAHTHSFELSYESASNLPLHKRAKVCEVSSPISMQEPFVIMSSQQINGLTEYSFFDGFNDYYVQHSADGYNENAFGSSSHTHGFGSSLETEEEDALDDMVSSKSNSGLLAGHTHSMNPAIDTIDNNPPFITTLFYEFISSSSSGMIPTSAILMSHDIPFGYELLNEFSSRFVKGCSSESDENVLAIGGHSSSHSHEVDIEFSIKGTSNLCYGGYSSSIYIGASHTHNDVSTTTSISNDNSSLPPYYDIFFIQKMNESNFIVSTVDFSTTVPYFWMCSGTLSTSSSVCNSKGSCIAQDTCFCETENYYGDDCREYIDPSSCVYDKEEKTITVDYEVSVSIIESFSLEMSSHFSCSLIFNESTIDPEHMDIFEEKKCVWNTQTLLMTSNLKINDVSYPPPSTLTLLPMTNSLINGSHPSPIVLKVFVPKGDDVIQPLNSSNTTFWKVTLSVLLPIFLLICFCCCAVLIAGCCVVFVMTTVVFRQARKIQRYSKIKNVDIILQEQLALEDDTVPHFKMNEKLFEIDYSEISLIKAIGQGGSNSIIYKATWSNKIVCFKVFKTNAIASKRIFDEFEREIKIASSINHPNLIHFFGCSIKAPRIGIVMEYCENGDLKRFLKLKQFSKEKISNQEKLRFLREICSAMIYLHDRDIIHRDLKLQNVLLDDQLTLKLIDFGLSKFQNRESAHEMTKRVGTSVYMSPEITLGVTNYDQKVDVFSFAIMMYCIWFDTLRPYEYIPNEDPNSRTYGSKSAPLCPSITNRNQQHSSGFNFQIELLVANDGNYRPALGEEMVDKEFSWIVPCLRRNWDEDPEKRDSFKELNELITEKLSKYSPNQNDDEKEKEKEDDDDGEEMEKYENKEQQKEEQSITIVDSTTQKSEEVPVEKKIEEVLPPNNEEQLLKQQIEEMEKKMKEMEKELNEANRKIKSLQKKKIEIE